MLRSGSRGFGLLAAFAGLAVLGCNDGSSGEPLAGGGATSNSGGSSSATSGSGGSTSNPTGGSTSNPTGGSTSNPAGGSTSNPTGGSTSHASGGSSASITTSGSAGSTGTGSVPSSWNFDTTVQYWTATWAGTGDATNDTLKTGTKVEFDSAVGEPSPGSLKVTLPFTAAKDKTHLEIGLGTGVSADLSGKTITAKIRLDSGLSTDAANPGGANLFVKSGSDWAYGGGEWVNLEGTAWITLTLSVTSPIGYKASTYDPTKIVSIGIQIATSDTGTGIATATVHIDSVTIS